MPYKYNNILWWSKRVMEECTKDRIERGHRARKAPQSRDELGVRVYHSNKRHLKVSALVV